ncbi:sensor histidine kinase [Nonomuraea sp. NPDC003214]
MPARASFAAFWAGPGGVITTVMLFLLPLLYTIPRGRVLWSRYRGPLLAAQAALTYLPFLVFGPDWVAAVSGLLGGLILLTVRYPLSWLGFCAIVVIEVVLRTAGVPAPGAPFALSVNMVVSLVSTALTLFGLVRLADLVTELHTTRRKLAAAAADQQRRRSAGRLREAVGDHLQAVTDRARAALDLLPGHAEQARARLIEGGSIARQALQGVRAVAGEAQAAPPQADVDPDDGILAPRLARAVLVVVLAAFLVQVLANAAGLGITVAASVAAVVVVVGGLQLHHSAAYRTGARPRGWVWTLSAQTAVSLGSFWVVGQVAVLGLAGFAAGSALLLVPGRWAWAVFLTVAATVGVISGAVSPYGAFDGVYAAAGTAAYGLAVYGLSRLTDLARQVATARRNLAMTAALRERSRLARDIHDLLGLGLSAVALKCDLVVRLIGRDDRKARSELEQLVAVAATTGSDIQAIADRGHPLSLEAELVSAGAVLALAGVQVHVEVTEQSVPSPVAAVLAISLREAVTNVVRHATARECTIMVTIERDSAGLRVVNDGLPGDRPATPERPGHGLANLAERAEALGGSLTTRSEQRQFEVAIRIPLG